MLKYDLYLYRFLYSDSDEPPKIRPVMISDSNKNKTKIIVIELTHHEPRDYKYNLDYAIRDWKKAGLDTPSTLRFDQVNIADTAAIREANHIGHLTDYDIEQIENMIGK